MRLLPPILGAWTVAPVVLGIGTAVAIFYVAHRRHLAVQARLVGSDDDDPVPLPSGRLLAVVAATTCCYGIAAAVALWVLSG